MNGMCFMWMWWYWLDLLEGVVLSFFGLISLVLVVFGRGVGFHWECIAESAYKVFDGLPQQVFTSCLGQVEIGDRGSGPWDTYPIDWASGIRQGSLHGFRSVKLMGFRVWSPQQWCFHWDYMDRELKLWYLWVIVHDPGWLLMVESVFGRFDIRSGLFQSLMFASPW